MAKGEKKVKKEKAVEVTVVHVSSADAFCSRSCQEKIRAAFQVKPSPQNMIFPTPFGKISVSREAEKGAQATWFATDEKGTTFKGTKKAVRENVGEMIAISHRLFKMGRTLRSIQPENKIEVPA